jgi:hypothetical protein
MFEHHSNFTIEGSRTVVDIQYRNEFPIRRDARNHPRLHRLVELGFYVFTSADSRVGWQWVGDHIRPRRRGSEIVEVADGSQFVGGDRLSAGRVFAGYMDDSRSGRFWTRPSAGSICASTRPSTARFMDRRFHKE